MFQKNAFNHVEFFKTYHTKFTQENAHDVEDFKKLCVEIVKTRLAADLPSKSPHVRTILERHVKDIMLIQISSSGMSEESKFNAIRWFGLTAYALAQAPIQQVQQNNTAVEITSCSGMKCIIS